MRRILATLLLALLAASAARAAEVSPRQRALLLLRVLVYDRALAARAGPEVTIAVAYRPGLAGSEQEHRALLDAYQSLGSQITAAGKPVRTIALPYTDAGDFAARLASIRPAAVYVCSGLEEATGEIAVGARASRVLAFAGTRAAVVRGIPIGLVDRGDRAGVLVDPGAATAAGADLDSALLSVAELVGATGGR